MRAVTLIALAAGLLASATAAQAASLTFTNIDNPGDPTFNQLLGITNGGEIVGYFGSGAAGHPNQGYSIAAPYTQFVSANVPGSVQTQATGIAAGGFVTGFWSPTNMGAGDANYGFVRWTSAGHTTYIGVNDPLGGAAPPLTQVLGINASGVAAGFYGNADGSTHGFTYNVLTGGYQPVNIGALADAATGINASNVVSGFFTTNQGQVRGFLKSMTSGAKIEFAAPGAAVTQFLGVNSRGIAAGFFAGADNIPHGLLYNGNTGHMLQIDNPNAVMGTVVNGLNDRGQLVGFYTDAAGNVHGMLVLGAPATF